MNLVHNSSTVRILLTLSLLSVFSGYANHERSCTSRAARIACSGAQAVGSVILTMGGILALKGKPTQQPPAEISPAVLACTSIMLLGLGASGIYNAARDLRAECCENRDDEQEEQYNEQKED